MEDVTEYAKYLDSKEKIDRKSLNGEVLGKVKSHLGGKRINALDFGTGTGSLIRILIDSNVIQSGEIIGTDVNKQILLQAPARFSKWASSRKYNLVEETPRDDELWRASLDLNERSLKLSLIQHDVNNISKDFKKIEFDLVSGMSILDILDPSLGINSITKLIKSKGILYLLMNYDGGTIFEPTFKRAEEETIMNLYDKTMCRQLKNGGNTGGSYTGRRLFHLLIENKYDILGYGPSDWVIHPSGKGYPPAEGDFLKFILETIRSSLNSEGKTKRKVIEDWFDLRLKQLNENKLVYICHQMDIAGCKR